MKHNIKAKNNVPAANRQILLTIEEGSDIINSYSLGIQPSK